MKTTSLQTGVTSTPFSNNAQDFSGSDDDIVDNFAEGPDDGVPLGVGGEKGKQSEPASSTLEADIVNRITPDVETSETPAGGSEPVQEPASETSPETIPGSDGEEPDIPPMLLQMAGYADADAARADGLGTPEALNAFIRGRGQLLASQPTTDSPAVSPYGLREQPPQRPPEQPRQPEVPEAAPQANEFQPFQLTDEDREILDERLIDVVDRLNTHNQKQFDGLRASLDDRDAEAASQQEEQQVLEFDKAVQGLGEEWQEFFGEGDFPELVRKGQTDPAARIALQYRDDLFRRVHAIRKANSEYGFNLDLEGEIGYGLQQQFPDKFKQVSSNSSAQGSKRTSLNRPSQRKTPDAQQDHLLRQLHKRYPSAGFTMTDPEEFDGDI